MRFESVESWLAHCRSIVKNDLDNVVLLAGDPGNGKSTLMFQLARALDDTFTADRCHFTIDDFLSAARELPAAHAIAADELLMHRRKGMHGDSIRMIDHLQVCRGLNHHIFLCFPHAAQLDRDILDRRVRYRIDIEPPTSPSVEWRIARVTERIIRTVFNSKGEEEYAIQWRPVVSFRFARNSGPLWEEYLAKKLTAARMRDAEARGMDLETAHDEEMRLRAKAEEERRGRLKTFPRKTSTRDGPKLRIRPTSPLAEPFMRIERAHRETDKRNGNL